MASEAPQAVPAHLYPRPHKQGRSPHLFALRIGPFFLHLSLPVDPNALPQDAETLKKMLVAVTAQLDRTERLLRQLLQAKTGRRSEQLSREQLAFATELGITSDT